MRRPLQLTGTVKKSGAYQTGNDPKPYVMGVALRAKAKRSDWGMNYGVANGWVSDYIELIIAFEARECSDAEGDSPDARVNPD